MQSVSLTRIGRYSLGEVLGTGGAGTVYQATLDGPGSFRRTVALKVLHDPSGSLRREARIGGLLRHPNLVDVYEVGEHEGRWFCAMEACDDALERHVPLPPRAVVEVGQQVCAALAYAHRELGLVHLDLKPANLLLKDGVVKVADLGIARAEGFAGDGRVRGTPGYMAPEQALGAGVDSRTDLYALGITLVELATGSRPAASGTLDLDSLDLDEDPAATDPDVPEWLSSAVGPCIAAAAADRWADMESLSDALGRLHVDGPGLRESLGIVERDPAPRPRSDSNLPPLTDAFLGRDVELDALAAAMTTGAVVTLGGPPGIGKSRLALEAARQWHEPGRQAWWCDLADVADMDGVARAVAQVIDVPITDADPWAQLGHALSGRGDVVVVLDNADRHTDALGPNLAEWHAAAPDVRLLVTARASLPHVHGIPLSPLAATDAVALLVARAGQRGVDLVQDADLAALATRLEGVPLALELAAGRLGVLSVADVLERLGVALLRRGTAGRHGTLQAALDWAFSQLPADLAEALARLSVFHGGFSVEAAEAVLGRATLELLEVLSSGSWLRAERGGRLSMLSVTREYVAGRLRSLGQAPDAEVAHARFFARFGSRTALDSLDGPAGVAATHALALERGNLLAAARRSIARGESSTAAATALAAWAVLQTSGPVDLGAELLSAANALLGHQPDQAVRLAVALGTALEASGESQAAEAVLEPAPGRARALGDLTLEGQALSAVGVLFRKQGRYDDALGCLRDALRAHRDAGDRHGEGVVLSNLSSVHQNLGEFAEARECAFEALSVLREIGARDSESVALVNLGISSYRVGELEQASEAFEAALGILRHIGNRRVEGLVLTNLGALYAEIGDNDHAWERYTEALACHREVGHRASEAVVLGGLGMLQGDRGELDDAHAHLVRSVGLQREVGNPRSLGVVLGNLGQICVQRGQHAEARGHFDEACAIAENIGHRLGLGHWLGRMARLDALEGDLDVASSRLDRAEVLLRSVGDPTYLALHLTVCAEVLWRQGATDRAFEALDEARSWVPAGNRKVIAEIDALSEELGR